MKKQTLIPLLRNILSNHQEWFETKGNSGIFADLSEEDLEKGNFVLFRQKGEKEVLSLIAEDIAGKDKYDELIRISQLWKDALLSFSSPRVAFKSFKDLGFQRTSQTVSIWMKENLIISQHRITGISRNYFPLFPMVA